MSPCGYIRTIVNIVHTLQGSEAMKSRSKSVLVTGASGFIGSAVAARFSAAGYAVRCLLRKTSDNRRVEIADGNAMVHIGDISEEESLVEAMKGCDAAVNCAGLNSFWEKDRSRCRTGR